MIVFILTMAAIADPPSTLDPAQDASARELFLEGRGYYAAGRYEDAAARFEEAYALSDKPLLLFNLANVYERLADYDRASDRLRRYLAHAPAADREAVEQRLQRLERMAAQAAPTPPVPPPPATVVPSPSEPVPQPFKTQEAGVRAPSTWPVVAVGGLTLGATASALTFGLLSRADGQQASEHCSAPSVGDTVLCLGSAEPLLAREASRATLADVSAGVAVVGATATAILALRRGARSPRTARVELAPTLDRSPGVRVVVHERRRTAP
ncbi:MAG: tetratricopeptide repeat protein [Myxococcota bacterium]